MCVTPCQDSVRRRRVGVGVARMITPMVYIQRRIMNDKVPKNKKDHLIPACIIGSFSKESGQGDRRRNNIVSVKRRGKAEIYETKAGSVLYSNGEYDSLLDDLSGRRVTDGLWDEYESELPKLIKNFESRMKLSWDMYIETLVPYVASLFIRDQGYRKWVNSQANNLLGEEATDETTQFNRGKFYAENKIDILAYSIDVLVDEMKRFILPDRGISFIFPSSDEWRSDSIISDCGVSNGSMIYLAEEDYLSPLSFLVPISSKIVIKLTPRENIYGSLEGDTVPIRYIDLTQQIVDTEFGKEQAVKYINTALAQGARDVMIGADKDNLTNIEFFDISDDYFVENILAMGALIRESSKEAAGNICKFYRNVEGFTGEIIYHKHAGPVLRAFLIRKYIKPSDDELQFYRKRGLRKINKQTDFKYIAEYIF